MLRSVHVTTVLILVALLAPPARLLAQRGLPDPNVLRPPLITEVSGEASRAMAAHFQVSNLVQVLRQGDSAAAEALLGGIAWGATDASARARPECASISAAIGTATATKSAPHSSGNRLALTIAGLQVRDSSESLIVTAVVHLSAGSRVSQSENLRMVLSRDRMKWTEADGLLTLLCAPVVEVTP